MNVEINSPIFDALIASSGFPSVSSLVCVVCCDVHHLEWIDDTVTNTPL